MIRSRTRELLAATAVSAVLVHGLTGHGLPQMTDDGIAGAAAGFCVLLVGAAAYVAPPKRQEQRRVVVADAVAACVALTPRPRLDRRARASPSALQRFRN
jgi:hypothetical protein